MIGIEGRKSRRALASRAGRNGRRKLAVEVLQNSEQTVLALLNAPPDAALLIDTEGIILALNKTARRRLGWLAAKTVGAAPPQLIGHCVYDLFPPDLARSRKARNDEVVRTCKPVRYEDERDGKWFDSGVHPVCDEEGNAIALAVFTRDITDRKDMEESLRQLAYYDHLTGLPNRLLLEDRFNMARAQASRNDQTLAVMSLDLDGFKNVNDALGHAAGDSLLQGVAGRLTSELRESDTVARLGGDEFVMVLPSVAGAAGARRAARRVLQKIRSPITVDGHELRVTTSVGASLYPTDGSDLGTLLRKADEAMYRAKEKGKNGYQLHSRRSKRVQ